MVWNCESGKWDEQSFFSTLEAAEGRGSVATARTILDWTKERNLPLHWGEGIKYGSFSPRVILNGVRHQLFAAWTNGFVNIYFGSLQRKQPFASDVKRLELMRRLNKIPGVSFNEQVINREPSFKLGVLAQERALSTFFEAFDWAVKQIKEIDTAP